MLCPLFFCVLTLSSLSSRSVAAEAEPEANGNPTALTESPSDFADANWFFYLSAGAGRPTYDDEISARIDAEKADGRESPQAGFFDFPGVYRQVQPGLAVGAILTMSFENYATKWRDPESFAIQSYNPSVSAFYFPGGRMGLGWFGRGDVGASRIYQRLRIETAPGQFEVRLSHRDGLFTQLAFGSGWEASHFALVLVHVNALLATAESNNLKGATLNIGFLL